MSKEKSKEYKLIHIRFVSPHDPNGRIVYDVHCDIDDNNKPYKVKKVIVENIHECTCTEYKLSSEKKCIHNTSFAYEQAADKVYAVYLEAPPLALTEGEKEGFYFKDKTFLETIIYRLLNNKIDKDSGHTTTFSFKALQDELELLMGTPSEPFKSPEPVKMKKEEPAKPETRKWFLTKPPAEEDFYVKKEIWETLIHNACTGRNSLLIGPSGCGKTELCQLVANAIGYNIDFFNFGAMTEPRMSLIGTTEFSHEKGTYFNESLFVKANKQDKGIIVLDELSRSNRDAYNLIFPLLDGQKRLSLDEDKIVITRSNNLAYIATANVGSVYTGTSELDAALKQRFVTIINLDFPPKDKETNIVIKRTGISYSNASLLVSLANNQREMIKREDLPEEFISTRMLLNAGYLIADGFKFATAIEVCICNCFNSDGGNDSPQSRLKQIAQKQGIKLE